MNLLQEAGSIALGCSQLAHCFGKPQLVGAQSPSHSSSQKSSSGRSTATQTGQYATSEARNNRRSFGPPQDDSR